jgi:uncharacterized protein (DUF433 family)
MPRLDRITISPDVCRGQPSIRGLRITVSVVLKLLAEGKSEADLIRWYPELEPDDIRQAWRYAAWVASERFDAQVPPTP